MVAPTSTKLFHLRLGIESGEFQQDGVLVFDDIPVGATVHARVNRPTDLNDVSDLVPAATEVVAAGPPTLTWAAGPPSTVTRSAGSFITDGFRAGMRLVVDSPLNGGTYTIIGVTATVLTIVEAFVAEGPLSGGETLNGGPGLLQPYVFERAPLPAPFNRGAVLFDRQAFGAVPPYVPSGANPSSRQRTFVADGLGNFVPEQYSPAWAAAGAFGSLAQKGKAVHQLIMPGHPTLTPNLPPEQRNMLRMRWLGTQVTGANLGPVLAAALSDAGQWANAHHNLVPGSIAITLPTAASTLLDNGKGRLVGPDGDGYVDYPNGTYSVEFRAAETGQMLVTYQHDCGYRPLDVNLTFDPLMAQ